jgi:hypothetical protein
VPAQGHHITDDHQRRRVRICVAHPRREIGQRADHDLLGRRRGPGDVGRGRGRRDAARSQARQVVREPPRGHEQDHGVPARAARVAGVVSGREGDGRGVPAMRQRDARVRGRADRGRDARDDLERDAGLGQLFGFLAASSENQWVATLEAHHGPPRLRALQHRGVQAIRDRLVTTPPADREQLGVGRRQRQDRVGHELVVGHDLGRAQELVGPQRQQPRVAGTGPDQVDEAATRHASPPCAGAPCGTGG